MICGSTWCADGEAPESEQLIVARYATLVFGVAAVGLGIVFKTTNVALHGGSGVRHRGEREFPGAVPVDLLAAVDDGRGGGEHVGGRGLGGGADRDFARRFGWTCSSTRKRSSR